MNQHANRETATAPSLADQLDTDFDEWWEEFNLFPAHLLVPEKAAKAAWYSAYVKYRATQSA